MKKLFVLALFFFILNSSTSLTAQDAMDVIGKWDLVMNNGKKDYPSWLEVKKSGFETLIGRFVHDGGSARPISEVVFKNGVYSFSIPRQWESEGGDMSFIFKLEEENLMGTMMNTDGSTASLNGSRAPKQKYISNPKWGKTISVFNGKDLTGWHASWDDNQWAVENGMLINKKAGANLITDQKFKNFKLVAEFRYPKGSNSGIYLRGRHEVQIADDAGKEPSNILFGGIYGFLTPNEMAAKPAGEWQSYEITLNGDRVTVVANGKSIIVDQTIPGITGGALDSHEDQPGSIFIQGDHGPIEFRKFEITPMTDD